MLAVFSRSFALHYFFLLYMCVFLTTTFPFLLKSKVSPASSNRLSFADHKGGTLESLSPQGSEKEDSSSYILHLLCNFRTSCTVTRLLFCLTTPRKPREDIEDFIEFPQRQKKERSLNGSASFVLLFFCII